MLKTVSWQEQIKTSVVCESCCKEWKWSWAWQKPAVSVKDVIWVMRFGSLSLSGRIDHRTPVGWSMQMLMDQCQWSCFKVQSTICASRMITANIAGFFIKQHNEFSNCLQAFLNELSTGGHTVRMFRIYGGMSDTGGFRIHDKEINRRVWVVGLKIKY